MWLATYRSPSKVQLKRSPVGIVPPQPQVLVAQVRDSDVAQCTLCISQWWQLGKCPACPGVSHLTMWHMDVTLRSSAAPTDTSIPRALTIISRTVDCEAEAPGSVGSCMGTQAGHGEPRHFLLKSPLSCLKAK